MFSKLKIFNRRFTQSLENGFAFSKRGRATKPFFSAGFTLLELLVVIGIATVIMTALVIQQSKWNDQLIASSQAYELALMIRQAQVYSLGVRENVGGAGDRFNVAYGVVLKDSFVDPDGQIRTYKFFVDANGNGRYDAGEENNVAGEPGTKTLSRGAVISKFCGVKGSGQPHERCYPGNGNVRNVEVLFARPNPSALISMYNAGGNSTNVEPPVEIYIQSPGGRQYKVTVESNGQISVTPV